MENTIGNDLFHTYITHPKSKNIYSIYSKEGVNVVKKYLHTVQKGGHKGNCSSCKNPPPPSFYNKSSHNQDNNFDENMPFKDTEFVQEGGWGPFKGIEDENDEKVSKTSTPNTLIKQHGGWGPFNRRPPITGEDILEKVGEFFKKSPKK